MTPYAIGDVQGCGSPLSRLLKKLPTEPIRFVGDLVNRGPDSLGTIRAIRALGDRARCVLGNHDIHLLAVYAGVRKRGRLDTLDDVLGAPDAQDLIEWLRHQPLLIQEGSFTLVHAGLPPQWTIDKAQEMADEAAGALRSADWKSRLPELFGNTPTAWNENLGKAERIRFTINALTRLRFCKPNGEIDLSFKGELASAPEGLVPWFDMPDRKSEDVTVVCGHWSALGLHLRPNLIALDSGCVWGGKLTAVRLIDDPAQRTIIQVDCEQAQAITPE